VGHGGRVTALIPLAPPAAGIPNIASDMNTDAVIFDTASVSVEDINKTTNLPFSTSSALGNKITFAEALKMGEASFKPTTSNTKDNEFTLVQNRKK
jgi:hypothetical protein